MISDANGSGFHWVFHQWWRHASRARERPHSVFFFFYGWGRKKLVFFPWSFTRFDVSFTGVIFLKSNPNPFFSSFDIHGFMNVFRVFFSVVVLNIFNVEIPQWDFYNWTAADRCSSGWNVSAPEFHSFFFPEPNRVFTELYRFHFLNFDRFSCLVVSLRTGWSNVFLLKLVLSLFFFWLDLCWNWCQKVFRYLRFWEGLATNLNEIRMVPFFFDNFLERAKFPVLPFLSFVSFFFDGISRLL